MSVLVFHHEYSDGKYWFDEDTCRENLYESLAEFGIDFELNDWLKANDYSAVEILKIGLTDPRELQNLYDEAYNEIADTLIYFDSYEEDSEDLEYLQIEDAE